jgi:glycosyltransferase involved in cell wall biosynthesis
VLPHEKRIGDTTLTRYFLQPVHAFIAMSREVLNDLRRFTAKKAAFIPHPVYDHFGEPVDKIAARQHLGLEPDKRYVLFFGFIRAYKGLDLVLEAFSDEAIRRSDIRLIVAGEFYENRQPYDELIHKYRLQPGLVLHTDFIPNEAVRYYFSAADIVVQPYRSATQSGISQMAYHFNKPMIVTNVGGLPEIVPDGKVGYVVPAGANAIAEAIKKFYRENKAEEFIINIREEKKKYDWSFMTDKIIELAQIPSTK